MLNSQNWVDNLSEGDEVAVRLSGYSLNNYKITRITKITPSRIITTESNHKFNKDGRERGKSSAWYRPANLQPVTPEIKECIERSRLLYLVKSIKFEELPLEKLKEIESVVKKEREA